MRKMHKIVAVALVVAALAMIQPAVFAAPSDSGVMNATSHSSSTGLFGRFMELLAAIWGGGPGHGAAIWGGGCRTGC